MDKETFDKVRTTMNRFTPVPMEVNWRHVKIENIQAAYIAQRDYLNSAKPNSFVQLSFAKECLFLLQLIKLRNVPMVENK